MVPSITLIFVILLLSNPYRNIPVLFNMVNTDLMYDVVDIIRLSVSFVSGQVGVYQFILFNLICLLIIRMLVSKEFSLLVIVVILIIYHSSHQTRSFHLISNIHHHQVLIIMPFHSRINYQ